MSHRHRPYFLELEAGKLLGGLAYLVCRNDIGPECSGIP